MLSVQHLLSCKRTFSIIILNIHKYSFFFFFSRISFCSADANYDRVVAFIGTNKNETLECHAFLCSKRKVAEAAALTISQAFNIAFELWERAKEEKSSQNGEVIFFCHLTHL